MSLLVICEHREHKLRDVTFEALGAAESLNLGPCETLLLGEDPKNMIDELSGYCSKIAVMDHKVYEPGLGQIWLGACLSAIKELDSKIIIMPATSWGMELAPYLAEKLDAPFAPDVTQISFENEQLTGSRMVYSGKLVAKFKCVKADRYVITIRPGAFAAPLEDKSASIRELAPYVPEKQATEFIGYLKQAAGDVDITAAKILVSVGRGIGGPENIHLAEELAKAIGGVVSCSRPVADKKWLEKNRQVGTSGQTVRPDIYLALGISGAFQHVAGMQGAGTIMAINKDPKAPIFGVAHYGLVGDVLELLPLLSEKVKQVMAT